MVGEIETREYIITGTGYEIDLPIGCACVQCKNKCVTIQFYIGHFASDTDFEIEVQIPSDMTHKQFVKYFVKILNGEQQLDNYALSTFPDQICNYHKYTILCCKLDDDEITDEMFVDELTKLLLGHTLEELSPHPLKRHRTE